MQFSAKIVDENGTPVGGAGVELFADNTIIYTGTSSTKGRFEFSDEADYTASSLKVRVSLEGFEPLETAIRSEEETDLPLKLLSKPSAPPPQLAKIAGKITDKNFNAISGAKIVVFAEETFAKTHTTADGRFSCSIKLPSANQRLSIEVNAPGFRPLEQAILPKETRDLAYELERMETLPPQVTIITGKVTDKYTRAVAGANITVLADTDRIATTNSAADGSFALPLELPHTKKQLKIVVSADGFEPFMETLNDNGRVLLISLQPTTRLGLRDLAIFLFLVIVGIETIVIWARSFYGHAYWPLFALNFVAGAILIFQMVGLGPWLRWNANALKRLIH